MHRIKSKKQHQPFWENKRKVKYLAIFIMSIISYILLMLGEIPSLKIFGIFQMQLSDVITLATYFLYGVKASLITIVGRYFFLFLSIFPFMLKPIPVCELVSLLNSFLFLIVTMFIDRSSKLFRKGKVSSSIGYLLIITFVSFIMFVINYTVSVPTLINNNQLILKSDLTKQHISSYLSDIKNVLLFDNYTLSLFIMHLCFYPIQGIEIVLLYDLIIRKNISYLLSENKLDKSLIFKQNGRELLLQYYQDIKFNRMIVFGKKYKKKEAEKIIKENVQYPETKTIYQYNFIIDKFGYIKQNSIKSEHESIALISNFMKTFYPASPYKITNYEKKGSTINDNYTDALPLQLYKQVNKCKSIKTQIIDVNIEILKNA